MTDRLTSSLSRRAFLKGAAATGAAALAGAPMALLSGCGKGRGAGGKRVIVIGVDGMDPVLAGQMMDAGRLPTFARLANAGGFRKLGTSTPPQSPVAWANFINGAGPGSHGLFDFIHRDPSKQAQPKFSIAETHPGHGGWEIGDHRLYLDFWPFDDTAPYTELSRQGTPFWDYLDKAAVDSTFYNLPSNYPPSKSKYGHHRCLAGLGTTDLLGQYGTYQLFHDNTKDRIKTEGGGFRTFFYFENGTCDRPLKLRGPGNSALIEPARRSKRPEEYTDDFIEFLVHRDLDSRTAAIEIQGRRLLLTEGQWSDWVTVEFDHSMPWFLPDANVPGICRFYLQSIHPIFRLYVSPINVDPSQPAAAITEPMSFARDISDQLGLFPTTGFQEAYNARRNNIFSDAEYADQGGYILEKRLELLDYALKEYDDGVLFFYFSSADMQGHFFWWDGEGPNPVRSAGQAKDNMEHIRTLYERMDETVARILKDYGDRATVIAMSDHGFCNFKRQFSLNTWLRDNGYLFPATATDVMADVDWSGTQAFGMGINSLYLNLAGRERDGIVSPAQRGALLDELVDKLKALRDDDGQTVISDVHRGDRAYHGPAAHLAPDLVIGYNRGYRSSWDTTLGKMTEDVLSDNTAAWSADHCSDPAVVPGVLFANRPIAAKAPTLTDLAPSVLAHFGLTKPSDMTGSDLFTT